MRLKGKVAVVTGASSGLGREIALLFAKEGAKVVAVARREERLEELVKQSETCPGKIVALRGDMAKEEDIDNMIDTAVNKFGKLDILVNNAGIIDEHMTAEAIDNDTWNRVIDINLTAPLKAARKALPIMLEQGKGNIINMSSVGGLHGGRGGAAYVASKHGLIGLTKNIGFVYADRGIRCNAISPGAVGTEIGTHAAPNEEGLEKIMSGFANAPRTGEVDEIANITLFLASDESSLINGTVVVADAGWTAY